MKLVLDSSVGVKWVMIENLTDKARLPRDDFRNGIIELLAPDFFPLDVLHALTKAERQKRIRGRSVALLISLFSAARIPQGGLMSVTFGK